MKLKLTLILAATLFILTACSSNQSGEMNSKEHGDMDQENIGEEIESEEPKEGFETTSIETLTGNEINIVAKEVSHQINNEVTINAWTFNGSVPGSQIRVKEGEKVKIHLKNELSDPVTIHWHGIPLPNEMDGIPGVTQNAVQPGETFTYEFIATHPGTYMYHTHQEAVNQMDKGLYGSFIVEPKEATYDRDFTLMLDEWISNSEDAESMSGGMDGMDHSNMSSDMDGMDHNEMGSSDSEDQEHSEGMGHDMSIYDIFTINGKSGDAIEPLKVKEGETVRLRLANVGYMSHNMHLHGHEFKVVAIDGQELNEPEVIKDQLISIAPGERYDIEFTANNPGEWYLECHGDMEGTDGMKALIQYEGNSESIDQSDQSESLPVFNFTNYGGSIAGEFTLDQQYDIEYSMDLNGNNMENVWTINDKSFPDISGLSVKEGDLIKVKLTNNSPMGVDHPMHLHGHFFQVLSKNGKPLEGSPIIKDTLNVKSGEEYVVAFKADNPGNWLFHCHDLHHATAGMVDLIKYEGFQPNFTPDPNANNKPE
ncbi:multicopper oxidase family protein [Bacillus sp. PS06]|uniref:multicopper oxidase family protein n=1 Tax=Bacillus sp. PS06 TaxID=2764176 RepID=UPI00178383CA|nr:multicopper oxidase family protein [Bacillus sp. PS06]MBD8071289.1 multicopper oxidase family protein [Bacillus sp. PS06]